MSNQQNTTTDHATIREWIEARNGTPARVKATRSDDASHAGILRVDFPGFSGEESLEPLDWDTFFETFDAQALAFVYQEKTNDGSTSRFSKFVSR